MLNAIVAALAGSQSKMMGVIGGISVLINQFRHQLSIWVSHLLGQSVRPEILDVVFSLLALAVLITVAVAFFLYLIKRIARVGKSTRLGARFASAHMEAVAAMAKAAANGDLASGLRSELSDLVHEVETLQKKSKRLRAHNAELEAAFNDYVHLLTVFSAATGGARISNDAPLEADLAGLTEAAFNLTSAFGYAQKNRKLRRQKNATRIKSAEIDHALRGLSSQVPAEPPAQSRPQAKQDRTKPQATPDVIVRTQKARAGKRMSRRERRKLSPWDQPEQVRAQQHTGDH
ncbi:MAG: hypothetical protein EP347_00770 [Alphaproteobacteria bacterium]|nr:MAG: hypothetical protein EP347_00770 [Alphaproteobacteria bacterium]